MLQFCGRCNELVGNRHYKSHILIGFQQMSEAQRRSAANQMGSRLARLLQLDPGLIVIAFLSALEDAGQNDFSKMVQKRWAELLKH